MIFNGFQTPKNARHLRIPYAPPLLKHLHDMNQRISVNGECTYDVWLTRAIIFVVDGREVLFEKDVVPFSEEIIILKGYELEGQLSDAGAFLEGWDEGIVPECYRDTVIIH